MNSQSTTPHRNVAHCRMNRIVRASCLSTIINTAICLLATVLMASAHHALDAEFDRRTETEYRATVLSLNWENPHASFCASVAQADATPVWIFELPSPSGLVSNGWTPESLRNGDIVTVRGFPAKNGSARASVHSVTLGEHTLEIDHPFARPPANKK